GPFLLPRICAALVPHGSVHFLLDYDGRPRSNLPVPTSTCRGSGLWLSVPTVPVATGLFPAAWSAATAATFFVPKVASKATGCWPGASTSSRAARQRSWAAWHLWLRVQFSTPAAAAWPRCCRAEAETPTWQHCLKRRT